MCIRDYIRRKTTRVASQVSEVTNEQQQTLMPTVINENEPQYLPVREIGEKLDTDNLIRNIALTGPYGSGKSTVLYTLQQDYKKHTYLQISLATLESYDLLERDEKKKDKKDIEQLNRLIEYSILQQLIYREKYATVPNSRIKRIFHFDNWKLFGWTVGILLFFIAFLIAFEPSWLRVETMYRILDMGPVANSVADILSVLYMLFGISVCIRKILSAFCGYQLSRFNLKDGEVELKEASIFNKHLDEIIYFFQRTKYDVVIIEDLDRFNTSDIYLKLRELNQLINESKEIGRHIVFIYAVKDDVFKDEQRAKFFDYITTVIPIINPSNSKDKLNEALRLRGYEDIADDDLEEMAFFINDMRLLQNIANEYQQYRTRLCATGQITLNPTKLLGMIVYKNYFPKDFAQLHNREGDVYKCIAMKPKFIVYALQQLDEQKKQLEQKIKEYYHSAHIAKNDLREICAYQIIAEMPQKPQTIKIEQKYQSLKEVIKDEELFEQMISEDQIDYQYHHILYGTQPANFNIGHTGLKLDRIYWNRKRAIEELPQEIQCERKHIDDEERKIKSLRLHELLTSYDMGQCTDFTGIKLAPMLNVFLRQGYIDEDYYDYISYFYEGMITLSDYHLLLTMKQAIKSDYNAKIDKVGNFAKKIPLSTFNYDSVLNIQLADCLSVHNGEFHEKFELLMKRIERNNAPLDFIAQYYQNGHHSQLLFQRFIKWNPQHNWQAIQNYPNETERTALIEGWLKFCNPVESFEEQRTWLDNNYSFLTDHKEAIGLEQLKWLSNNGKYNRLNSDSADLLQYVITNSLYALNCGNLCVILNYLAGMDKINPENLNLKRVKEYASRDVVSYVEQNLVLCLKEFSHTINDEDEEALLIILNDDMIDSETKKTYLHTQQQRISDIASVSDGAKDLAIELLLIEPSWENVAAYFAFSESQVSELLKHYIEHYKTELGSHVCEDSVAEKEALFDALIGSNILEFRAYQTIAQSFNYLIKTDQYLADLESDRVDYLIDVGMIAFTYENTSNIASHRTSTLVKYLIHHKNDYLKNIDCIEYSVDIALSLLTSNAFTVQEKSTIIPLLKAQIIESNKDLASEICILLTQVKISLDEECLVAVIANASNIKNRILIVSQAITANPKNIALTENLLSALPKPYSDIAVHDRKHPILENNGPNLRLLDALKNIRYISSYKFSEKEVKINKKVWE